MCGSSDENFQCAASSIMSQFSSRFSFHVLKIQTEELINYYEIIREEPGLKLLDCVPKHRQKYRFITQLSEDKDGCLKKVRAGMVRFIKRSHTALCSN